MSAETQYTASSALVTISTANSNLDGTTGTYYTVLTAASNGTLIKTVTIKAITNTTQGMVRLFIYDGTNTKLISEIEIPEVTKSSNDPAFETSVLLNLCLESGWSLKASTEKGETFNVIAEGQNWAYYAASVRADTTKYSAYNAATTISTANTNLDGTGTMGTALVSSGCNLMAVTIKAKQSTTKGMVRLFLYNGSIVRLFKEIPVSAITQASNVQTFYHKVVFENGFVLKSGWQLRAATEIGESFNIIPESLDWSYPA